MTERQRLITKYITRLYPATATYYRLHFLRNEKDDSAIHMLLDNLNNTLQDTKNPVLEELIREIPKNPDYNALKFGQHYHKKKKQKPGTLEESIPGARSQAPADEHQRALSQFHQLELEDSLETFEKLIASKQVRNDKYYRERIEINLILQNYKQALLLAQKSGLADMAFVAAIAAGEFNTAKEYIAFIIDNIIENSQEHNGIASTFEMIHLVIFVLFATSTSKETFEKADKLFESTNFNLQELKQVTTAFYENNFSEFMKQMPFLKRTFAISIYTSPCLNQLVSAITQNITVLYLLPLAKASIDFIHNQFGIPNDEVIYYIKKSIREFKLHGKLNLVTMEYVSSTVIDNNILEMKQIFEKTISIRHEFELDLWVHEYNSTKAPAHSKNRK